MDEAERELELKILEAMFEAYKIVDAMHEADKIADPSRFMSAGELKHFMLPAVEASKDPENAKMISANTTEPFWAIWRTRTDN